jgi:hypothetical protein
MRTKTLLLAVAALATSLVTSQAQVYSSVVGYVSVNLTNGFNAVANQLDFDGTGTNNTILTSIGTNVPATSKVETYDPTLPGFRSITWSGSAWSAGAAGPFVKTALQPGGGVFVFIPASPVTNIVLTMTGQVLQQTNKTTYPSQFQLVGYPFPVAGFLTTNLAYAANAPNGAVLDTVETWNPGTQLFTTHKYSGSAWSAGSPNIAVGQAFFLIPNRSTTWTNSLIIQ